MKVGVVGGGFKPPHKGHYELVKQALAQVPDLDKMIIFVGKNIRDGIDQSQAVAIWNLYKDNLNGNLEIVPATKPPIGHVYSYATKNPEDEVYWFLGARDEEDKADIADRTAYLEKNREKYPNLNVEVVESTGTDVSGTAARKALKARDKEAFFQALPDGVDKDKVYDIVKTPETKMADAIDELFTNFMYEEKVDFNKLERTLDSMFADLDIDINFTTHFKERVVERGLTEEDIIELMQKIHDKYPDELDFLGAGENRVFTHLKKLVDIAAVNQGYGDDYLKDLVLKTAYKRNSPKEPEFRTNATSPKLAVAEITKGSPVAPIAVLPSEERQKLQNYTKILQDALPDEFDVEYRQDHIRVSVPYFDKNKNHQDDWTPHQRQLPEVAEETIGQFNFAPHIASILEYCMTKGMKVTPIPEVKIRQDEENAENLFGRTGYYQPETQEIVLYVTGRHPKDVLRSFCHELIHHMQNLEGRDLTFYTTDVHADEKLKEIEQEAHAKGSFLFRDWENSNKEQETLDESAIIESLSRAQKEDLIRQVIRLQRDHGDNIEKIAARLQLPASLSNKLRSTGVSFGKRFVETVLAEGKYDTITNRLSRIAFEAFKDAYDRGDKKAEFEFRVGNPDYDEVDIESTQFEFDFMGVVNFTEDTYKVDGGANAGFDDDGEEIQPMINVNFQIPKNPDWQEVSMDLKDVVRHELEHLTQDGENIRTGKYIPDDQDLRNMIDSGLLDKDSYFSLPKEVDAMIQGLYYKAKKSKKPFADVVNDYLDKAMISLDNKEKVLNLWRKRLPALGIRQEL